MGGGGGGKEVGGEIGIEMNGDRQAGSGRELVSKEEKTSGLRGDRGGGRNREEEGLDRGGPPAAVDRYQEHQRLSARGWAAS